MGKNQIGTEIRHRCQAETFDPHQIIRRIKGALPWIARPKPVAVGNNVRRPLFTKLRDCRQRCGVGDIGIEPILDFVRARGGMWHRVANHRGLSQRFNRQKNQEDNGEKKD